MAIWFPFALIYDVLGVILGASYHLVVETPDGNLSKGMRRISRDTAPIFLVKPHTSSDAGLFHKAVRGKFYRKGFELRLPIYLDAKLQRKLERLA